MAKDQQLFKNLTVATYPSIYKLVEVSSFRRSIFSRKLSSLKSGPIFEESESETMIREFDGDMCLCIAGVDKEETSVEVIEG